MLTPLLDRLVWPLGFLTALVYVLKPALIITGAATSESSEFEPWLSLTWFITSVLLTSALVSVAYLVSKSKRDASIPVWLESMRFGPNGELYMKFCQYQSEPYERPPP